MYEMVNNLKNMIFWVVCLLACRSLHLSVCLSICFSVFSTTFYSCTSFAQASKLYNACDKLSMPCLSQAMACFRQKKPFLMSPLQEHLLCLVTRLGLPSSFAKNFETENLQFRPCRPNCLWAGGLFGLHQEYAQDSGARAWLSM